MSSVAAEHVARCSCGAFSLQLQGSPRRIYGCACIECQRATGAAFAYRAVYPDEVVQEIKGEVRRWRRVGDAGRWVEQHLCPNCGTLVYMTAEAMPGAIAVSVGCFVDRELPPPEAIHNMHSAAPWLPISNFAPRT